MAATATAASARISRRSPVHPPDEPTANCQHDPPADGRGGGVERGGKGTGGHRLNPPAVVAGQDQPAGRRHPFRGTRDERLRDPLGVEAGVHGPDHLGEGIGA